MQTHHPRLFDLARLKQQIDADSEVPLRELAGIVGTVLNWDETRREEEISLALREAMDRK